MTREYSLARLASAALDLANEYSTVAAAFVYIGIPVICFVYYTCCQWRANE